MHRFIAIAATAAFLHASTAHAEPPAKDGDVDYAAWQFETDGLHAAGTNPYGEWLKANRRAPRAMLIRPRTSFVFELLASIGKL